MPADGRRGLLQEFLAQAERQVAEGEHHIARQLEVIAQLERDGHVLAALPELNTRPLPRMSQVPRRLIRTAAGPERVF
jgi:hypothetical protein